MICLQYNIFKVIKKDILIKEMLESGYITNNRSIKSGDYDLRLYYNKKDNSTISWQKNIE